MKTIKTSCTPSNWCGRCGLRWLAVIAIVNLTHIFPAAAAAEPTPKTTYQLEWTHGKMPVEVRTAQGPARLLSRVGENGVFSETMDLPIQSRMPDGIVALARDEAAVLYLFIKNTGNATLRFSVAPHSTDPGASALGFSFNCLCNGHIYEVPPHKIWFRIMTLKNTVPFVKGRIRLKHDIFQIRE